MTTLLCKSKVRQRLLEVAKANRAHKFSRVGADVYDHLEWMLDEEMARIVRSHPSVGKTITLK